MNNFTTVTELPGGGATEEQLSMAITRYNLAATLGKDKYILEIASGSGIGFGIMANKAAKVVGCDIDPIQVKMGNDYYKGRFELLELSAVNLSYTDNSFDLVIILEAIYYIQNIEAFINEVKRILRPNGQLLISYPNKDWANFNPSPYTYRYFEIEEMHHFLQQHRFDSTSYLGFLYRTDTLKSNILDIIRSLAVKFNLIPKSFVLKDILKRIFLGQLKPIPYELKESDGELYPIVEYSSNKADYQSYRVIYTIGTLKTK